MVARTVRRLSPGELGVVPGGAAEDGGRSALRRPLLVLVGLTGTGKTTTVERLASTLPLAAILPDRRALTDELILPMMTDGPGPVTDRVERFRLTAAFKERHPGGMGDVLGWLVLPEDLPMLPVLFDGLRGEAEVAAAAALPQTRFVVLDCSPEGRLWRICGRNDPFDRAAVPPLAAAAGGVGATASALRGHGFDSLVDLETFERLAGMLSSAGVDASVAARSAAIIVEESRHYDPAAARSALLRLAPSRTLVIDTDANGPAEVAELVSRWWRGG